MPDENTPIPGPLESPKIIQLESAVFGDRGTNGLVGKVSDMGDKIDKVNGQVHQLELGQARILTIIALAGTFAGIVSGAVVALAVKFFGG